MSGTDHQTASISESIVLLPNWQREKENFTFLPFLFLFCEPSRGIIVNLWKLITSSGAGRTQLSLPRIPSSSSTRLNPTTRSPVSSPKRKQMSHTGGTHNLRSSFTNVIFRRRHLCRRRCCCPVANYRPDKCTARPFWQVMLCKKSPHTFNKKGNCECK